MAGERYDLIAIGAGFAGLTAALRAAELGLRACVIEKESAERHLCNSRFTSGVFHVASNDVRLDAETLAKAIEAETGGHGRPELARAVAETAGRAVAWLRGHGVRFVASNVGYVAMRQHLVLAPPRRMIPGLDWEGRGGDVTLRTLEARLAEKGGAVRRGVRATGLVTEDGRCVGVETDAGRLSAGAVVIADGGFQADPELLRGAISPAPERLRLRAAPNGAGEGLRMARAAGAAITDLAGFYGHLQHRDSMTNDGLWPYPNIDVVAVAGIVVDRAGKRFADEGRGAVPLTNAVAALADPLSAFAVCDEAIWQEAGASGIVPPNPNLERAGARVLAAPDLPALAAACGLPAEALEATVAAYNAALAGGAAEALDPPRTTARHRAFPIERPPFRAIPLAAGLTTTMGGIAIDGDGRVLREDGGAIPGLYAAGSCTGGLEGGPRVAYIGGVVKAFVLGLRAGEAAARDAGKEAPT